MNNQQSQPGVDLVQPGVDLEEGRQVSEVAADIAIVGGGIAGCWLLRLLSNSGYRVILFEQEELGCDQTLASQGMIHGGLKYALGGTLNGSSEAIAGMPRRWRRCLAGDDDVDLQGLPLLADTYHMFAQRSTLGRLTTFFASKALRGRVSRLDSEQWPSEFTGFNGVVYDLNDFVVDVPALLSHLVSGLEHCTYRQRIDANNLMATPNGYQVKAGDTTYNVGTLVSCAGNGSRELINTLGLNDLQTQSRPLKQVVVRPKHGVKLNAHCVTGVTSNEPRLTITSYGQGTDLVWYVGGLLATTGVDRSDAEQIAFARRELAHCVPWLDWTGADYSTLDVDRAEPYQGGGVRPDEAYVTKIGNFIQCFPTKLTLAPDLGDRVLSELPPASTNLPSLPPNQQTVDVGHFRW
ncbi:MAG: FAD-dependent oxidoreductase [Pseudomonadales bacterium]|nr:FAD-dependent oxidoreductase [Pseudomonadales bacterium]